LKEPGRSAAGRVLALFSMLAVSIAAPGCGGRDDSSGYLRSFESIVGEALELYGEIHPLRSSRLGITDSDSLLFTFSADEIDYCGARCDSLLERISRLPANHFEARAIDDSAILIDWLRGELFALRKLRAWETNPLLYCWMAEEALFGIPSRIEGPGAGELRSYERRLGRVPALLENAGLNLRDPPAIQIEPSLERIGAILEKAGELRAVLKLRYGTLPASFEEAVKSVESFGDYLRGALASGTQGSYILGTEKISDILLYSEHLDLDLDEFTAEAEKSIRKNMGQIASIERSRPPLAGTTAKNDIPPLQAMIDSIGVICSSKGLPGSGKETSLAVIRRAALPVQRGLPSNPHLSVPAGDSYPVFSISASSFAGGQCGTAIVVPPGAQRADPEEFIHDLLRVSACASEPERALCRQGDKLRTVFASRLYALGWDYLLMKELCQIFPDPALRQRKRFLEENSRDLAMMVTVFGLHSGRFTVDAAVDYLISATGAKREDALRKVSIAASSPSVAYAGIAAILIEQAVQEVSGTSGESRPLARIRELMLERAALPLTMSAVK